MPTIRSTDVAATIYFSSIAMRRLFEGDDYSKYRRRCYYLFQLYRNAATIRRRRLFEGDDYSKYRRRGYYLFQLYRNAATIRRRLLFEVQTSRLLFISALPQCGDYSRAATIHGAEFIRGNTVHKIKINRLPHQLRNIYFTILQLTALMFDFLVASTTYKNT